MRRAAALIAALIVGIIAARAFAAPAQIDCTSTPCTYLPLVRRDGVAPTLMPTVIPDICRRIPDPDAASNYPIKIISIQKEYEWVTIRNETDGDTIDLTGWHMCSILGGQEHIIFGTIGPGETQILVNTDRPIWNNDLSDPGALYNSRGQLVSYYPD